jgi:hypothetical protein
MQFLRDILEHAQKNRVAIGHSNVADLVTEGSVLLRPGTQRARLGRGVSRRTCVSSRLRPWCEVFWKNSTSRFSSTQTTPTPSRTRRRSAH